MPFSLREKGKTLSQNDMRHSAEEQRRAERPRRGRPRKGAGQRQEVALTAWVTRADARLIEEAARSEGESVSAYLAEAARTRAGRPPSDTSHRAAAAERRRALARMGANLNQIALHLNTARARGDDAEVIALLKGYRRRFHEIGAALLEEMAK